MKFHFVEKYTFLTWAWLLAFSALTVLWVAPDGLNADILINSIMSLQKVTLYYWGQNRLLNILPLAVIFVKNPELNLVAVLVLSSVSFYGLLYLLSRCASRLVGAENEKPLATRIFLITSSGFILFFKSNAISEIAIGHIEYSFSAFLLIFAFLNINIRQDTENRWKLILPAAAVFFAIGLNPSSVIPTFIILIALAIYKKTVRLNEVIILFTSGFAFVTWSLISKQFGSLSYNEFKIEIMQDGIQKVLSGLLSVIDLPALFLIIIFFSFIKIGNTILNKSENDHVNFDVSYINHVVIFFSVGWLLLFSANRWVELNNFAWRYFIYIIFSFIFLSSLYVANCFKHLSAQKIHSLSVVVAFSSIVLMGMQVSTFSFKDYKVFRKVNSLTKTGSHLYAGDYWVVWPSVLRDMMYGYEAYGLTYRGEANGKVAREYVLRQFSKVKRIKVYCLNEEVVNCISQSVSIVGPLYTLGSSKIKDGVYVIEFSNYAPTLDIDGKHLLALPSQVSIAESSARVTESRAGYLLYGPYAPLRKG